MTNDLESQLESVLNFWFTTEDEWRTGLWFKGIDPTVVEKGQRLTPIELQSRTDEYILQRFQPLMESLDMDQLEGSSNQHKLAAIILWDRVATRNKAQPFKHASKAQQLALELLPETLPWSHTLFVCVALLHAEDATLVEKGMERLQEVIKEEQDKKRLQGFRGLEKTFVQHLQILQNFGRYPNRNEVLGRSSTAAELEHLKPHTKPRHQPSNNPTNPNVQPLKILVLHGNRTNLRKFKAKVRDKLKKIGSPRVPIALDFIKSPNIYKGGSVTELEAYERDNRCWWTVKGEGDSLQYEGIERGIEALESWFQHGGSYDGIIGFSQGATMAAILAAKMHAGQLQRVRFQFLICISGFNCRDTRPEYANLLPPDHKIRIPSFHTWGDADKEIDGSRSQLLADAFHEPNVMPHQGEHFVRGVEFWPTAAMSAWLQDLPIEAVSLEEDTGPLETFEEKFQAIKRQHVATSLKGNMLRPIGLHHQEEIVNDPFWEETSSTTSADEIPVDTAKAFISRLLLIAPEDGVDADKLLDDCMAVIWCVYPFGLARKKQNERRTEGQIFYLMFRLLVDGVQDSASRDRLLQHHLPFLAKNANSWDALNRVDLLFHTGSSLRGVDPPPPKLIEEPSPYAGQVHTAIAEVFAEQLAVDFQTIRAAVQSNGDSQYEKVLQMQLALPSKCAEHVPRIHGFVHRTTQLDAAVADEFSNKSQEALEAYPGVSSRNRYDAATKEIKKFLDEYKSGVGNLQDIKEKGLLDFLSFTEAQWWELHQRPISQAVLDPKPEPVEISTPEQMAPLQEFLNKSPLVLPEPEVTFDRGTLLDDGRLDLCKQVIGPKGVNPLFESLYKDDHGLVKHILLGNNIAGNGLGRAVGDFIRSGESKLTTWYVAGNRMNVDGIQPIAEALEKDKQVLQLWLKRNPLLPAGAGPIASMLRVNTTLQVLDLTNTGILDVGCERVMQGLLGNESSALQYLYLDTNGITPKGVAAIVMYLTTTTNKSLVGLSLGCNRLGDEGVSLLIQGLRHYKSIKRLNLASCGISAAGAKLLADYLKEPTCDLRFLDLGCMKSTWAVREIPNRIGSDGAIALTDALKINTRLEGLGIGNNFVREDGIAAMEQALSQNQSSALRSLAIHQPGLASSKLTLDKINLWVERNAAAWEEAETADPDDYVFPKHLDEIQSVYRVGDSYDK